MQNLIKMLEQAQIPYEIDNNKLLYPNAQSLVYKVGNSVYEEGKFEFIDLIEDWFDDYFTAQEIFEKIQKHFLTNQ